MLVDHKFTLVGPTVLAPGVYLPPFYYYSLIPFLWLFKFHLIGPDIYTALLGIASIGLFYLLAKDLFGIKPALISSLIFSLNPYLIQVSRHAWNPNTIYFFTLLFSLSFERYLAGKKGSYLLLAPFSLAWAINLHLTVLVFIPLLVFLFAKEFYKKKNTKQLFFPILVFIFFVSPIFIFEIRHNFPNTKGVLFFLRNQGANVSLSWLAGQRILNVLADWVKMPLMLFSGLNQAENLTINPSHILLFDKVSLLKNLMNLWGKTKLVFFFLILAAVLFCQIKLWKTAKRATIKFILLFLVSGFAIRLFFPPGSFYFYHYTFLFPYPFLAVASFFGYILKKNKPWLKIASVLLVIVFCFLALFPEKIIAERRGEKYFLPVCALIDKDFTSGKIVIAANLIDQSRWDHNALEYRYFLEAFYRLPLGNWEEEDYRQADVLYLIDEGELKEPLKLKGMEMEAFGPVKIEKTWEAETGQKIYKMTK
ncbi:glycosyltransferase family 39 protein [Patescibacteria group bacterium]|nr:glycosyltransferase family 39 protein [Patescibacteria group bacterium]